MKKWIIGIVLGCVLGLFPHLCDASGVVTVQGKLTSITHDEYVVETPRFIYLIRKSKLPPQDQKQLSKTEVPVSLTVPFNGIDAVKPKKVAGKDE